ncbi:MAG: amidohydrolase family protein [Deltaproteobacteria bacterium]|nr:amidohydrolase family protein [Deltaproteobacteria bacterium]
MSQKPSEYLKKLYFDSIVHSVPALQYLIQVVGADRVVVGTDYPMAMGEISSRSARSCSWIFRLKNGAEF